MYLDNECAGGRENEAGAFGKPRESAKAVKMSRTIIMSEKSQVSVSTSRGGVFGACLHKGRAQA